MNIYEPDAEYPSLLMNTATSIYNIFTAIHSNPSSSKLKHMDFCESLWKYCEWMLQSSWVRLNEWVYPINDPSGN